VGEVLERLVRRIKRHLRRTEQLRTNDDEGEADAEGDPDGNLAASAVFGQAPPAGPQWLSRLATIETQSYAGTTTRPIIRPRRSSMPKGPSHELSALVSRRLQDEYKTVHAKVHRQVDGLTDDQLWRRPFPYGNSVGHLLLHLTGNLSYYIGAQIAVTGYVRNRPLEFTDDSHRPKEAVLGAFDAALVMVTKTLTVQTPEDWSRHYEAVGTDVEDRLAIFVHCVAHADHHAGQMIYLVKQLGLLA
jgi:uncharacterized damage-inducible protein DinB